jgi:hypothetical protein
VGQRPQDYGVTLHPLPEGPWPTFAKNDIAFTDPTGTDHDALGAGLKKAIYNYMHGLGLEEDVRMWWDFPVPKPRVARQRIARALAAPGEANAAGSRTPPAQHPAAGSGRASRADTGRRR